MKKSTIAALVAGTALAAFTYGCGGDNANAPAGNANTAATPRATVAPTVAPTPVAPPAGNTGAANTGGTGAANTGAANTRPSASPAR